MLKIAVNIAFATRFRYQTVGGQLVGCASRGRRILPLWGFSPENRL